MELDEKIQPGSVVSAEINSVAAEIIPWSFTPTTGQIAIDRQRGQFKYNSADAGEAIEVTYTPCGTVISAAKFSDMSAASLVEHRSVPVIGVPVVGVVGKVRIAARGQASRTVTSVRVYAGDLGYQSTTSEIGLSDGVQGDLKVSLAAGVAWGAADGAFTVDTSGGDVDVDLECLVAGGHGNLSVEVVVQ